MEQSGRLPWDKKQWVGGRIRPNVGSVVINWMGAIIFGGFGIAAVFGVREMFLQGEWWSNWLLWVVVLFPLLGVVMSWYALVATIKYLRFRKTEFWMEQMPGVIGGRFEGRLSFPKGFRFENKIKLRLVNEEKQILSSQGDDSGSDNHLEYLYSEVQVLDPRAGMLFDNRVEFPVRFTIPYETKDETDGYSKKNSWGRTDRYEYRWFMRVTAELPGTDLDLEFTVPIFRTAQSDKSVIVERGISETLDSLDKRLGEQLEERTIDFRSGELGEELIVTDQESRLLLLFVCFALWGIVGGLWWNGGVALVDLIGKSFDINRVGGALFTFFVLFMLGIGFSLFAIIVSYWYLDTAPEKEIRIEGKMLEIRYRLFGIFWEKQIPVGMIDKIEVVKSGSSNGRPFYDVKLYHGMGAPWWIPKLLLLQAKERADWDGKFPITMASMLFQKEEAHYLVKRLRNRLLPF